MFCENCGKTLPDGAKFCNGCGTKTAPAQSVNAEVERPAVNTAPPPVYTHPTQIPPQNTYTPPAPYTPQPLNQPLRVGQYIVMLLLQCIPLVGFILLLVWAFSSTENLNKKNYARAVLIFGFIGLVFSIILGVALAGIINELISSMSGYGYY